MPSKKNPYQNLNLSRSNLKANPNLTTKVLAGMIRTPQTLRESQAATKVMSLKKAFRAKYPRTFTTILTVAQKRVEDQNLMTMYRKNQITAWELMGVMKETRITNQELATTNLNSLAAEMMETLL